MSGIGDRLKGFGNFVWNSDEKKFLGRGGRSWAEIGVFYLIYYICLAGFFVGMLAVFYQTMDAKQPKLTGSSSLLRGNPGMGFQPMPDVEYTLVRFHLNDKDVNVKSIDKLLEDYYDDTDKGVECSKDNPPQEGEACKFNVTQLTEKCNADNKYGYRTKTPSPCVLLRLNKIFDWMPEKYTEENIKNSGASEELQRKILADPDMIYVNCVGENPADRDNLPGVEYFPEQGFRHYYYPFTNQANYISPLVFVRFNNPSPNIALMIECRALAPNINYDRTEKEGGVHFEMLMDP